MGRLSVLSASITHITAWQVIADAQERGPTLVIHEDENLREPSASRIIALLSDPAAFQPPFDLFYLNAAHPSAYGPPGNNTRVAPEHAVRIARAQFGAA